MNCIANKAPHRKDASLFPQDAEDMTEEPPKGAGLVPWFAGSFILVFRHLPNGFASRLGKDLDCADNTM